MFRRIDRVDRRVPRWPAAAPAFARRALAGPSPLRSRCSRGLVHGLMGLAALTAPVALGAQQGTITYTHSIKLDLELPPGLEELKARMPSALTKTMVLHFSPSGSLMTHAEDESQAVGADKKTVVVTGRAVASEMPIMDIPASAMAEMMSGMNMMVSVTGPPGAGRGDPSALLSAYEDYDDGTRIETREFLGRTFRVMDERKSLDWRMTTEQAMHLGYPVMKATAEQDSTVVEAWFTPQIPVRGGPASYGGLPGMILLLSIDDGKTQYQATEVALEELEAGLIAVPDEGREVSREEFDRIVADKMEEIMKTSGIRRIGRIGG